MAKRTGTSVSRLRRCAAKARAREMMAVQEKLHWGIIGTGAIACDFARALSPSTRCRAVDVVGSSPVKARAFAERFGLYGYAQSIDEMLANPAVDAVYIASPHSAHRNHALACIAAGKHVLCEKPLTLDAAS